MKVLMVDDSAADRKLFEILLREAYGPQLAFFQEGAGAAGLETCRRLGPDCVLLDYKLPDMTGLEFLAQLRSEDPIDFPVVAVVMLTGLASGQVAIASLKAGAQDYLFKDPITAEALSLGVEKATQKVVLLRTLKADRDRLARSLVEKEVLLKEVHHRVKNNLQVIASLLRLQATAFEDEYLARALRESQNRIESMALVHEQLYENEGLREIDMAKHAVLLAANMFHSYGVDPARISWHVTLDPLPLGVDQAIPTGLILNELISNALKHGFPPGRSGSIWVEGGLHDGCITLTVRDDGAGIPESVQPANTKSLGLQIVTILTRQLKGTLEWERGRGTTFRISFPKGEDFHHVESAGSGG